MDEELVGEKIDRLNSVISQLMTDIEENNNPRVSMISELQQSFFEYSVVNEGEGVEEMNIPQSVLDKFQESLTEIDRLGMQVEDLLAGRMRRTECFFNILLNHSQISEIHEKLGEALKSSEKSVILKIVNGKIEGLGVILCESSDSKSKENEGDCGLKKELGRLSEKFEELTRKSDKKALISKYLELEKKGLGIIEKEQKLDKLIEDYSTMLSKAEILVHEYTNKVHSKVLTTNSKSKKPTKVLSQDFTRTRTPASMTYPLSGSFLLAGFLSYKQEIETKIKEFEKLLIRKYRKKKDSAKVPKIFEEFKNREENFDQVLTKNIFLQEREKAIFEYLKESREFILEKVDELRRYQNFLIENWIKANGNPSGIDCVKQVLSGYLNRFKKNAEEREVLDDRIFRCGRIEESIRREVRRLQENTRKISDERGKLQVQLQYIERYLRFIANINRISNYFIFTLFYVLLKLSD